MIALRSLCSRCLLLVLLVAQPAGAGENDDFSWIRGANYVPSYARNDVQIWMDYDSEVIDRELGYAARLQLNSVRVFLQYAVYEQDPAKFLANFEDFVSLCQKHNIQKVPVVFDSCFGEFPDLDNYAQKDWMANPGQNRLGPEHWPELEKYVSDVVGGHRDDKRIVMWDVMNEPMCTSHARTEEGRETIWRFLDHMLDVARSHEPSQPVTVGVASSESIPRVIDKIDVLSWHNYTGDMESLRADIHRVKEWGREQGKPVMISEIARRNTGQHFWKFMPVLADEQIGWYFWELMLGKTQFSRGDNPIQGVIYPDGTCRDAREIAAILHPSAHTGDAKQIAAKAGLAERPRRWTAEEAWDWYKDQPWLVGFNYVPSTACNTTEWWQAETFDPETIDRELGWAEDLGFNTIRCFLQYLVWKHDPDGFKTRFDRFLALAHKHGISVMPVLFDDCAFGDPRQMDPYLGQQREPIPGMILPSWTPSPGRTLGLDPAERPSLGRYVCDMVSTFRDDKRIVVWDLYNEPMNVARVGTAEWLREIFLAARQAGPAQPLTISVWNGNGEINEVMLAKSDVVSFHRYGPHDAVLGKIVDLKRHGRPVVCTEWMARPTGSRIETDLPMFKQEAVGCYMWGFVNGRTQAQFPWGNKPGHPVREPGWFHDVLHADGTPYRPEELDVIRKWASNPSRMDGRLMRYADTSRGRPFAKDPDVVRYADRYWMYYSMGPDAQGRWAMGIAASDDLTYWEKVGEILPTEAYEAKGLVAGAALVLDGRIHLFYSTYGNGANDAICHAWSDDGLNFQRNSSNPVFAPRGDWNNGRAIDSDVIEHEGKLLLYCATRDPAGKTQMLVGAEAPRNSAYGRADWQQFPGGPVLKPELPWEKQCIEAPSICRHGDRLFMFYGGGYNNQPQQIGAATSRDGRHWQRLSPQPLLPNGLPGEWNSSESGHPGVFVEESGETHLFFQGNADHGKSWYLSKMNVGWQGGLPYLIRSWDGRQFHLRPFGEIRHTDDAVRYSDGWTAWRGGGPPYATLHYANRAGCTAEVTFEGTGIHLMHKVGPDCGIADILIDQQPAPLAPQIDTYRASVRWDASTPLAEDLAPGRHTLTIRVTGKSRDESSNTYVQIVGFEVRGGNAEPGKRESD
jgi:beta-1,2-mannobiose phosphorylase / 1,2-beta-oligomannan phosphorylase